MGTLLETGNGLGGWGGGVKMSPWGCLKGGGCTLRHSRNLNTIFGFLPTLYQQNGGVGSSLCIY